MSLKLLRSLRITILSDLGFIIGMYFDLERGAFCGVGYCQRREVRIGRMAFFQSAKSPAIMC
mgnify:CR=1 FL=1